MTTEDSGETTPLILTFPFVSLLSLYFFTLEFSFDAAILVQ
jgi:hypothetical protein